jgi:hypothetical protein
MGGDPREARMAGPDRVVHQAPNLEGIVCEVQHAVNKGDFTLEPGSLGIGVTILPTGQPRIILQVKHADGTSLGAMLKDALACATVMECLLDAHKEAGAIAAAAAAAKEKPQ